MTIKWPLKMVIQEVCIYRYGKILTKHSEKVNTGYRTVCVV